MIKIHIVKYAIGNMEDGLTSMVAVFSDSEYEKAIEFRENTRNQPNRCFVEPVDTFEFKNSEDLTSFMKLFIAAYVC